MKQRTLTVLYAIVLQHFYKRINIEDDDDFIGICPTINECWNLNLINEFEFDKVFIHFENQRTSKHNYCSSYCSSYWWNPYDREVRIKFLKMLIKKTKRK